MEKSCSGVGGRCRGDLVAHAFRDLAGGKEAQEGLAHDALLDEASADEIAALEGIGDVVVEFVGVRGEIQDVVVAVVDDGAGVASWT